MLDQPSYCDVLMVTY